MYEFTEKQMSDLCYDKLSEIKDIKSKKTEVILKNPDTESKFPCRVLQNPLSYVNKSENGIALLTTFQILVEHWNSKQRNVMEMANNTDKELQKLNILRTNTNPIVFDEITKKYRLIATYEVRYNALTNSFCCTK